MNESTVIMLKLRMGGERNMYRDGLREEQCAEYRKAFMKNDSGTISNKGRIGQRFDIAI